MPFVAARDLNVHYQLDGPEGAPVVAFANSLGCSLAMWDAQAAAFAAAYRVLRFDMRGHGLTDLGEGGVGIEELAHDAAALLDELDIERVHFVGLSIGGMIAQHFAATYASRVETLTLCATGSRIGSDEMWNARIVAIETDGMAPIVEPGMKRWFSPATFTAAPEIVRGFATMLGRTNAAGYIAGCRAVRDADLRADDTLIAAPTLIISGADDPTTPPASGEELRDAIAGARLIVLERAAHILCAERPDAVNEALRAFFTEHR